VDGVDSLTGLSVTLGVLVLLGVLAARGYVVQRRQLSSGRKLCVVRLLRDGPGLAATALVSISAVGQWCRVLLALRIQGEHQERSRPLGGEVGMVVGTPYDLTLANRAGDVLVHEAGTLARFAARMGGSSSSWSLLSRERSSWTHHGTVALLEFVPRQAGVHRIALRVDVRAEVQTRWSRSWCEVLEAELSVAEGVEPLSRSARYPHRRVEL